MQLFVRLIAIIIAISSPFAVSAQQKFIDESLGAPFRVRDYTFPSFLVLGFSPAPAAPLGQGHTAVETHFSVVNNFQLSDTVASYLKQTRGDTRQRLDQNDIAFILSLPKGKSFYIDGEVKIFEFVAHHGITDSIDIGVSFNYLGYSGGTLDNVIFGFHDTFDFEQHSRDVVEDDQFQVVLGISDREGLVLVEPPTSHGVSDPSIYMRYAFPGNRHEWQFNLTSGVKIPLADEKVFLSTGSWDFGFQLIADRRLKKDAVIVNLGAVFPGEFKQRDFKPPILYFASLNWLHQFKALFGARSFIQMYFAEHPFREIVDSDISDFQFQLTLGMKWDTVMGIVGLGITENLFNFNNTPDIGFHFTWGIVF